jgi:hypothetical protein
VPQRLAAEGEPFGEAALEKFATIHAVLSTVRP